MKTIKIGKSEIRLDDDGQIDEIVVCDKDGVGLFHMEDMGDGCFWANLCDTNPAKSSATLHIFAKKKGQFHTNLEAWDDAGKLIAQEGFKK